MGWLQRLWRIRGTIPVPAVADEPGLISRVGDKLEAIGRVIEEEAVDRITFSEAYGDKAPGEVDTLARFDEGEIRRVERNGRSILRYDMRLSGFAAFVLFWLFYWFGRVMWGFRHLPGTLVVVGLGGLFFFVFIYLSWRKTIIQFLSRTLEG